MKSLFKSRIWLVVLGIGLGFLARFVLGGPEANELLPRKFSTPFQKIEASSDEEIIDVPLKNVASAGSEQGLVPPIRVPGVEATSGMLDQNRLLVSVERSFDTFAHGSDASFEAHGEEVCASGCAASRHPTTELTEEHFHELLASYATQPMSQDSPALEELLYFGPQTKTFIEQHGFNPLDSDRATLLWDELKVTHAKISIRVIDEAGEIRTWLEPTLVPFDRRHVFKMETSNLQPLVTSGTVKRVGLDHIWVRL
jgi:hypothetical protein